MALPQSDTPGGRWSPEAYEAQVAAQTAKRNEEYRLTDSVSALVADPERLAKTARWSVESVLEELVRFERNGPPHHRPEWYADAAIMRRAMKDVDADIGGDHRLGWEHTFEEAVTYLQVYVAAFLAAWRDKELLAKIRAKYAKRGYIIVCYR